MEDVELESVHFGDEKALTDNHTILPNQTEAASLGTSSYQTRKTTAPKSVTFLQPEADDFTDVQTLQTNATATGYNSTFRTMRETL